MEQVASLPTPVPKLKQKMELIMKHKVFFQVATLVVFLSFSLISQAQIAFVSERDWNTEIYVMDADGNNLRNLTNNPASDESPSWSPDGQRIAFQSDRDGGKNSEIYVMDADGNNPRNLTNHPAPDYQPDWFNPGYSVSPAGKLRVIWGRLKQNSD